MAKSTLSLQIDPEGHIIVAAPLADARVLVAKFAPDGTLEWERAEAVPSPGEPADASEADDPPRDSFAPMLVDADAEGHPLRLQRAHRRGRLASASVLGAASLTLFLAAVGLGQGETTAAPSLQRFSQPVAALAARTSVEVPATDWIDPAEEAPAIGATTSLEATSAPAEAPTLVSEAPSGPSAVVMPAEPAPVEEHAPKPSADAYGTSGVLALRRAVLDNLTSGNAATARLAAQTLVMNSPSDAFGYLCLGAALDQLGLHDEAMRTYHACAEVARLGDVAECRALLSRPHQ